MNSESLQHKGVFEGFFQRSLAGRSVARAVPGRLLNYAVVERSAERSGRLWWGDSKGPFCWEISCLNQMCDTLRGGRRDCFYRMQPRIEM